MPDKWRILESSEDVDASVLAAVEDAVEWFPDGEPMGVEAFLDRLCPGFDETTGGKWDIESLDNAAVRKIMRHARAFRRGDDE